MADEKKSQFSLERFGNYLRGLANSLVTTGLRRRVGASDIVQDTFLAAWRDRDQLRGSTDAELAAWLRAILLNKVRHARRDAGREKRNFGREVPIDAVAGGSANNNGLPARGSTPSARALREESANALAELLVELPDSQREALVQKYLGEQSIKDIAASMQKSPVAVMSLLRRGLARMAELAPAASRGTSSFTGTART